MQFLGYTKEVLESKMVLYNACEAAVMFEDRFIFCGEMLYSESAFINMLEERIALDMCCIGVSDSKDVLIAERTRTNFPQMLLLLIAEPSMSPASYMKPSVMASSLLLRPLQAEGIQTTFRILFDHYVRLLQTKTMQDSLFTVDTKEGVLRIPYVDIDCFEAREKKVFVRTRKSETAFHSTLEKLCDQLPASFRRCHKGFIANMNNVVRITWTDNLMYFAGGEAIPIGRSYKGQIKEVMR